MYGVDPVWVQVQETIFCSRGTVNRLMKQYEIRSKCIVKWKATTDSNHSLPIAPKLMNHDFDDKMLNTAWVSDIPFPWTCGECPYTAIIKQLYTKEIVGYAMSKIMTKEFVIKALLMPLRIAEPGLGLIFHSSSGSQYCSNAFRDLLAQNEIWLSMNQKVNRYGNALAETILAIKSVNAPIFYALKPGKKLNKLFLSILKYTTHI